MGQVVLSIFRHSNIVTASLIAMLSCFEERLYHGELRKVVVGDIEAIGWMWQRWCNFFGQNLFDIERGIGRPSWCTLGEFGSHTENACPQPLQDATFSHFLAVRKVRGAPSRRSSSTDLSIRLFEMHSSQYTFCYFCRISECFFASFFAKISITTRCL